MRDLTLDEPSITEQAVGGRDLALFERGPHRARRHDRPGEPRWRHERAADAVPVGKLAQHLRRAFASSTEMEVFADHDGRGAEPSDEDVGDEAFRARAGESLVELLHEHGVDAVAAQKLDLERPGQQPEHRHVGTKEAARMGIEGQDGRRGPVRGRHRARPIDQAAVAEVEAVEIADRHHGAAAFGRQRLVNSPYRKGGRRGILVSG